MNALYCCQIFTDEILSVAAHVVTEWGQVLCASYAENPANHTVVYPACAITPHAIYDHACVVGTRLGAHRALLRIWRGREVASG